MTENKNKSGNIVRHRSIFCCTDEQLLWLRAAKCVKIDGTFKIAGEPFYQLVSIHRLVHFGHCSKSVTIGYIIMSGKTQADYTDIFQEIKNLVEEENGLVWNLEAAMLDFEIGLRNALKAVFDGIHLQGCWFHYCQAIWRKVHNLKLDGDYPHKAHAGKYPKRLTALALINANDNMIQQLFEYTKDRYAVDRPLLAPDVQNAFDKLFDYVAKQWIYNPKIPTSELSVFDTPVRTNNEVENWNGLLWNKAKKPKPFYDLLRLLRDIYEETAQQCRSTLKDTKKAAQLAIDRNIQETWDQMKTKAISPKEALLALCKKTEEHNVIQCNMDMLLYTCSDIDEIDEFDE